MVSGQNDRNNELASALRLTHDAASMVSGQNDRNNAEFFATDKAADLPQWCPAKMTGITGAD